MDESQSSRVAFETSCTIEEGAISGLARLVSNGRISLARVAEFSQAELNGAFAAALGMLATNRPAKALQIAGLLVFLEPHRAAFLSLVGLALLRLEQPSLAYRYYRLALSVDGDDPLSLLGCGEACLFLGNHEEAILLIETGCARAQGDPTLSHAITRARKLCETYASTDSAE